MSDSTDVIVVGAGPTGLTLAGFLGQHGVQVALVERFTDPYPLPRAVHLDGEVYRILHSLGVGEAFARITRPTLGLRMVTRDRRVLGRFERDPTTSSGLPEANMFDQPALEQLLRARLEALPTVRCRFGTTVEAIAQDAAGVTARTQPSVGPAEVLKARFLVGCDGANSLVAQTIGADPEDFGFEQRWVVVDIKCAQVCGDGWDGVDQVCDAERAGTFMRVGEDRYRWEFALLEGERKDDYDDVGKLRALIGPWVEGIEDDALELLRVAEYTFRGRVARRWRDGRMLIAGDAAHLTPPFIGQGMGAGVRDAANLAWKLARVCHGDAADALLDTYAQERRPHASSMVQRAILLGRAMTEAGLAGAIRQQMLPLLSRMVPSLGAFMLDSVTPPLTGDLVDPRLPSKVRGALLPLVRVPTASGDALVDKLLGDGFGIVALPDAAVDAVAEQLDARVVRAGGPLASWLSSARADLAVVRPDRTVLLVGRSGRGLPALPPALLPP